jgi:glycerate-2-kinase
MAKAINILFKGKIKDGMINVPVALTEKIGNIRVNKAAHPYPDENGLKGAKEILNIAEKATEKDLLICLISGGGSALMPLPAEGLSLNDKTNLTKKLLSSRRYS